jgi:hypothetical protein
MKQASARVTSDTRETISLSISSKSNVEPMMRVILWRRLISSAGVRDLGEALALGMKG